MRSAELTHAPSAPSPPCSQSSATQTREGTNSPRSQSPGHARRRRTRSGRYATSHAPDAGQAGGPDTTRVAAPPAPPATSDPAHAPFHFKLNQTHSEGAAAAHQKYIERPEACISSFGTIAETQAERVRLWSEIAKRAHTRCGFITLNFDGEPRKTHRTRRLREQPDPRGDRSDFVFGRGLPDGAFRSLEQRTRARSAHERRMSGPNPHVL